MRYRTKSLDTSYIAQSSVSAPGWLEGVPRPVVSTSPNNWGTHPGPSVASVSEFTDQTSPAKSKLIVNPCDHITSTGASFDGESCIYTYSPPAPSALVGLRFPMTFRPAFWSYTAPWGSMLDDLASLVEGSISDAAALPVTILEAAKTVAMIRNPFNLLKPSWRRQVRKLTARSLAKASSSIWLEGYYGWKSLYQDTESIAKATAHFLNDPAVHRFEEREERYAVRQNLTHAENAVQYTAGTSVTTWNTFVKPNNWVNFTVSWGIARLTNVSARTQCVVSCTKVQDSLQRISDVRRFLRAYGAANWRDVRDTLWEVIPFSFVIDWFVDSRGIWAPLNTWRLQRSDISRVSYSTKQVVTYHVELFLGRPNCLYFASSTPWGYQNPTGCNKVTLRSIQPGSHTRYTRYVGLPDAAAFDAKILSRGLSRIQFLNGVSLIAQRFF